MSTRRPTTGSATAAVAAAVLAAAFAGVAWSQSESNTTQRGAKDMSSDDKSSMHMAKAENLTTKDFVTKAAQGNLAEIKTSQLALSKTQNPEVRSFAQRMISDHEKANSELEPIAREKNIKVPDDTDMKHKAAMKLLQSKSGASFDSAYIDQMNKDHEKTIDLFQSAANSSKVDPDVKQFANKTLPVLEQHHDLVGKLESDKSGSTANH